METTRHHITGTAVDCRVHTGKFSSCPSHGKVLSTRSSWIASSPTRWGGSKPAPMPLALARCGVHSAFKHSMQHLPSTRNGAVNITLGVQQKLVIADHFAVAETVRVNRVNARSGISACAQEEWRCFDLMKTVRVKSRSCWRGPLQRAFTVHQCAGYLYGIKIITFISNKTN
jgi:hypothetical protein